MQISKSMCICIWWYMFEYLNTSLLKRISRMICVIIDIHLWIYMISNGYLWSVLCIYIIMFSLTDIQMLLWCCRYLKINKYLRFWFFSARDPSRRYISMVIYAPQAQVQERRANQWDHWGRTSSTGICGVRRRGTPSRAVWQPHQQTCCWTKAKALHPALAAATWWRASL